MDWWTTLCNNIAAFFNMPLVCGLTVGSFCLCALGFIFKNTSFGKKSLNKLTKLHEEANTKLDEAGKELLEVKENFENYKQAKEEEINVIKENYEIKLVGVKQINEDLEKLILDVCENIHNVKIQDIIDSYIAKAHEEIVVSEVIEKVKEETRSEYEARIAELERKLDEVINNGEEK